MISPCYHHFPSEIPMFPMVSPRIPPFFQRTTPGRVPGLAVVQHLEEFLDVADVQIHGGQPDLHLVVFQDPFELLAWCCRIALALEYVQNAETMQKNGIETCNSEKGKHDKCKQNAN